MISAQDSQLNDNKQRQQTPPYSLFAARSKEQIPLSSPATIPCLDTPMLHLISI